MLKLKKISTVLFALVLSVSTVLFVPVKNDAYAASKKFNKVNFSSSINRTFDGEGYDYFYVNLKNNQAVNINLKDSKKKEIELMLISGVNINSFKNHLVKLQKEDDLDELFDDLEELSDGRDDDDDEDDDRDDLPGFLKNLKVETILDTEKDDDSIGQRKTDIGLKKGSYIVLVKTDDDDDYGNKYNLSINNSSKKNLEIESNDSFSKAMSIKRSQVYQSSVFTALDKADYYKVSVAEAGNLVIQSTTKQYAEMSYTIYDANKNKQAKTVKKSGKAYSTQATVKKGTYYVRVTSNLTDDDDDNIIKYNLKAIVKTKTPKATVVNKKGTSSDTITVSGLKKGAKVIVYKDSKKKSVLATTTAKSSTVKIKTKKLTDRGGKVYVTVKNNGLYTSSLKSVSYKAAK